MKNIILFIMFSFIYLVASAQQDSDIALKNEFIIMETQSKPSVLEAHAEIVVDVNNRVSQNDKLTVQHLTIQRSDSPATNIMPTVELATDETLKTAKKEGNQPQSVEITLEPQSKPSGIMATAMKAE